MARFLHGLDLLEPGIVPATAGAPDVPDSRPEAAADELTDANVSLWSGVGIKR